MTWHFNPSGETVDVYDHAGELVSENHPFSGTWSNVPQVVYDVMYEEALAAFQANDTQRVLRIIAEAAFEDIEEGTPE